MFTTNQQENSPEKKKDASWGEVFIAFGIFICVIVFLGKGKIEYKLWQFYYENFELIWLGVASVVFALVGLILWQYQKSVQKITLRTKLLKTVWKKENGIKLGKTFEQVNIHLSDKARCGHVQIIGSTGRGKTESVILPMALQDIRQNHNTIIIDGKGSYELAECLKEEAKEFHLFDLGDIKNSAVCNPLAYGTSQQITDRIFTAFEFEDPFYKSVQYDICLMLTRLLEANEKAISFKSIYEYLTDNQKLAQELAESSVDAEVKRKLTQFLAQSGKDREKNMAGLTSQLSPFAIGEIAGLVNADSSDVGYFSLSEIVLSQNDDHSKLLVILIPTLKYQQIGHQLGKIFMQELAWAIGKRERASTKHFLPVFLDEFSAFVYPEFSGILNKARSANVGLHLAHQSLGDLSIVSDSFARTINTNTNVKCLLGLNDPETADFFARHLGTEKNEKLTEQAHEELLSGHRRTGAASIREVESYKIHPNELKNYTHGQGVIHLPTRFGNLTEEINFCHVSQLKGGTY